MDLPRAGDRRKPKAHVARETLKRIPLPVRDHGTGWRCTCLEMECSGEIVASPEGWGCSACGARSHDYGALTAIAEALVVGHQARRLECVLRDLAAGIARQAVPQLALYRDACDLHAATVAVLRAMKDFPA